VREQEREREIGRNKERKTNICKKCLRYKVGRMGVDRERGKEESEERKRRNR
jgi:hypothetical protein